MALKMKHFVLSPESSDMSHSTASKLAMLAYADAIRTKDEDLAADLEEWVDSIESRWEKVIADEAA